MLEVAIMVQGQEGVGWDRWRRLALAVEELGYAGLYRSDHFPNKRTDIYRDGLELWSSLAWNTSRIEFGPLVSPVWFRHPVITAWQASSVDNLAGGRLRLGPAAVAGETVEQGSAPPFSSCMGHRSRGTILTMSQRGWPIGAS